MTICFLLLCVKKMKTGSVTSLLLYVWCVYFLAASIWFIFPEKIIKSHLCTACPSKMFRFLSDLKQLYYYIKLVYVGTCCFLKIYALSSFSASVSVSSALWIANTIKIRSCESWKITKKYKVSISKTYFLYCYCVVEHCVPFLAF